jgi:hypothetical protein
MNLKQSYTLLKLNSKATADDARRAYKRQVKIWHPDRFSAGSLLKSQAEERIKAINLAYELVRQHLLQTRPEPASLFAPHRPISHRSPLSIAIDRATQILDHYGRRLLDGLASAMIGAIEKMASGTAGSASDQATRSMGRRRRQNFRQELKTTGSWTKQRFFVQPLGRVPSPHGLHRRPGFSLRAGGGPVAPIEGIRACDAPQRIHRVEGIAPIE